MTPTTLQIPELVKTLRKRMNLFQEKFAARRSSWCSDIYDVLTYIIYVSTPITRRERVMARKLLILSHYNDKQQEFLNFVLDHYMNEGVNELNPDKLPQLIELKYRSMADAVAQLGKLPLIRQVFIGFQRYLYDDINTG